MNDMYETKLELYELSNSFILLFDKLKYKGAISQEEYDTHTKLKKEFIQKVGNKEL